MTTHLRFCFPFVIAVLALPAGATGDATAGQAKSATCAACHGPDGNSPLAMWPKLAGQHESYMLKQLTDFKAGRRVNDVMRPMMETINEQDMRDLSAYFAAQKINPGTGLPDVSMNGKEIYRKGDVYNQVIACIGCHGIKGEGNPRLQAPALGGQHADYVVAQLKAFKDGARGNDVGRVMRNIASGLSDDDMHAVAQYVTGLSP